MKGKNILIIVFVALVVALIIFVLFAYKDRIFGGGKKDDNNVFEPFPPISVFPLRFGSKGQEVMSLQQYLLSLDPNALPRFGADGDWGSETQAAVSRLLGVTSVTEQKYNQLGL